MSGAGDNRSNSGDAYDDNAELQQIGDSVSRIAIGEGDERREFIVDDDGQLLQEIEDDNEHDGEHDQDDDLGDLEWRESDGFEEGKDGGVEDAAKLVFRGHGDSVYAICARASAPGLVVTGGGDDKGYLWRYNRETFALDSVIALEGHTDSVTSVGISPDGKLVSTAALDGTIRIWRAENGELLQVLDGPSDTEWSAWHSTGGVILAGSSDGTVWMWLAATGQCMQVFAGHEGPVACGDFTGDGRFIVTGGEDGTVRVWGPKIGKCRHVFGADKTPFHEGQVTCLAPHKGGELLASGAEDGTVRLMHVVNQRVLAMFVHTLPQAVDAPEDESKQDHDDENDEDDEDDDNADGEGWETEEDEGADENRPTGPARASDRRGINVDDEEIDVSEEDEGEEQEFAEASLSVESIGFCHTHKWMASGGMDRTMKIWDLGSNLCRHTCQHGGSVIRIMWHPLYPLVYTASTDGVIRLWSGQTGACMQTLEGHEDMILDMSIVFATNQEEHDTIFTCSDDRTARIFSVNPHEHFNASANTASS